MRMQLYDFLVNRKIGIRIRYHRAHDGAEGFRRLVSYLYLLWMNLAYYILFLRFYGDVPEIEYYESKKIPSDMSESMAHRIKYPKLSVEDYVHTLIQYDVVSFDVFDTLILRPLDVPADLFYLIGERIGMLDFKNLRIWAEAEARRRCKQRNGHTEVTLDEIWRVLAEETGCDAEYGARLEQEIELKLCYANPYMLEVWEQMIKQNKLVIVITDMYLPQDILQQILLQNGFYGYNRLYVSCEYGCSKADGVLYECVKKDWKEMTIIHVGDNLHSDKKMAERHGLATLLYPNVKENTLLYRPYDMSYLVGSAYRGIVSNYLYSGWKQYDMEYEYGFIYGGLFVLGYCHYIHDYCRKNQVDKLLFLSRDGDILKLVYDSLYPEDTTQYAYWSRRAAAILMAGEDKHDFFRRFVTHKVNQQYKISEILHAMDLDFLTDEWNPDGISTDAGQGIHNRNMGRTYELHLEDELTQKNAEAVKAYIEENWSAVLEHYQSQQAAAEKYYAAVLNGVSHAAAVDIGWAGSGALALDYLVRNVWKLPCEITGIIAGTNTIHNGEPDASEPFLQSERLVAYLYSGRHNRDLWKLHDPNKGFNVFWELLVSSPTPQFYGFYNGEREVLSSENIYMESLNITLCFGERDANIDGIRRIQQGILDFVQEYRTHYEHFPYMMRISGRDAYAPIIAASSHKAAYLHAMEHNFNLQINV
ncbi:MAG: hypothetical protein IJ079_11350 [Lachnospiraceae bacterium]|nr:hypothetical protein [Lachnospiraceae bacterium]